MSRREIFVFGSNRQGRHGKGAALFALEHKGAVYGQGEGLQGDSYAIPTRELRRDYPRVGLEEIARAVGRLLVFAKSRPDLDFKVTPIGCGLAGRDPEDIAPMFAERLANVHLPESFLAVLSRV